MQSGAGSMVSSASKDRQILGTIDEIYRAALDVERWPKVIASVRALVDAEGGVLFREELGTSAVNFLKFDGLDASVWDDYQRYYSKRSVWMPVAVRRAKTLFVAHEHVDTAQLEKSEFYNDWMRPACLYDGLGGFLRRTSSAMTWFSMVSTKRAGLFDEDDKRLFVRVLPHVRRALHINRRLYATQFQRDGIADALNELNVGVIVADERCRVVFANALGEAILRQGDGLLAKRRLLQTVQPEITQRLGTLIREAVRTNALRGEHAGGVVTIPTSIGQPMTVLISPAPPLGLLDPSALLFVSVPRNDAHFDGHEAARHYGLTIAEGNLLRALLEGRRLGDYAKEAGIAPSTARSHLQQLFAKTGTSRQVELVRLCLTDPFLRLVATQAKASTR
jgi:DNA-binding CsgD family transcriptional regulator